MDYLEDFENIKKRVRQEDGSPWYLIGCAETIIKNLQNKIKEQEERINRGKVIAYNLADESQILERLPKEEVLKEIEITDSEYYLYLC